MIGACNFTWHEHADMCFNKVSFVKLTRVLLNKKREHYNGDESGIILKSGCQIGYRLKQKQKP